MSKSCARLKTSFSGRRTRVHANTNERQMNEKLTSVEAERCFFSSFRSLELFIFIFSVCIYLRICELSSLQYARKTRPIVSAIQQITEHTHVLLTRWRELLFYHRIIIAEWAIWSLCYRNFFTSFNLSEWVWEKRLFNNNFSITLFRHCLISINERHTKIEGKNRCSHF